MLCNNCVNLITMIINNKTLYFCGKNNKQITDIKKDFICKYFKYKVIRDDELWS